MSQSSPPDLELRPSLDGVRPSDQNDQVRQPALPTDLLLDEIAAVQDVLVREASHQNPSKTAEPGSTSRTVKFIGGGAILLWVLRLLPIWSLGSTLGLAVVSLLLAAAALVMLLTANFKMWKRRRVDTLQQLQQMTTLERPLVQALLPFSRAALLHVAASARAADQRVGQRIGFFLGPNRAGGLFGGLVLCFGIFSAGKYLQDNQVKVLGFSVTSREVLWLGGMLLLSILALLLAHTSVSQLNTSAELLERVAALKKNAAEDSKDLPS